MTTANHQPPPTDWSLVMSTSISSTTTSVMHCLAPARPELEGPAPAADDPQLNMASRAARARAGPQRWPVSFSHSCR